MQRWSSLCTRLCFAAAGPVLSHLRFCNNNTPVPTTQAHTPSRMLDDISEISDDDKELIRRNLQNPKSQPASMGGAGIGPAEGDMVAAFTCGVCDVRSVKRFTKHSYTKGIVIVECPGCFNKHLLADNLGWFDDAQTNIEEILRSKGKDFVRVGGSVHIESTRSTSNSTQ